MCGIAGVFNLDGEPTSARLLRQMTDAIAHRGPDGEGHFVDGNIGLGHRRLAIVDPAGFAHQPMLSEDSRLALSFNGEIFNFQELRDALEDRGHRFRGESDTEVLIHGYEEEGIEFVEKLNGMFAFALWDSEARTLYLARDRFGVKPLYWTRVGDTLLFASEIKALLVHPRVSAALDYDALNEYFTFQNLFRYHTLFRGVNLVQAASIRWIREDEGTLHHRCYWDYDFTRRNETLSLHEAKEETLRLLRQAIARQVYRSGPIGVCLSGGMDSGSILALASEEVPRAYTFTCGFHMDSVEGVEASYDERIEAELLANHFKSQHYEQVVNAEDVGWVLPRVVYHLEDLRVGMSYPNYYITQLASKFVRVCLNGAGGDELYGGYPWRYYRIFRSVDRDEFISSYYNFWQRLVPDSDKPALFTSDAWRQVTHRDTLDIFRRVFLFNEGLRYDTPEDHIANAMYFEIKTFLHALFIVEDRLASAHGLEERPCFMDNDLVEFAQRIPIRHKLRDLEHMTRMDENEIKKLNKYYREHDDGKNVLREAMRDLIPEKIRNRKKQGFSAPDESWYRGENLAYVRRTLLDKRAACLDFIRRDCIEKTIREHCDQHINHRLLIWSFLCFEWWCRIFLDGQTPDPAF